jgi:nucleoside-diphosphate-sugar epimerase
MRVAITGAGGQVGAYLALRLASGTPPAHDVIAICRNFLAAMRLADSECTARVGSISGPHGLAQLLDGCDAIIHCAHQWTGLARRSSPNLAMIKCISRASSAKLFIYMSSVAAYSSCIQTGINTFEDPRPVEAYGKDKLMCEQAVMREFSAPGRRAIVIRLGHVYGPHFYWSRRMLELSRDARFGLPFGGRLESNAIRADRVCDALDSLLEDPPAGIYNLTDDPQRTWGDVFAWHSTACGLGRVANLEDNESLRIKNRFLQSKRRGKVGREMSSALRATVVQIICSSPSLKGLGSALLEKFRARSRWLSLENTKEPLQRGVSGSPILVPFGNLRCLTSFRIPRPVDPFESRLLSPSLRGSRKCALNCRDGSRAGRCRMAHGVSEKSSAGWLALVHARALPGLFPRRGLRRQPGNVVRAARPYTVPFAVTKTSS